MKNIIRTCRGLGSPLRLYHAVSTIFSRRPDAYYRGNVPIQRCLRGTRLLLDHGIGAALWRRVCRARRAAVCTSGTQPLIRFPADSEETNVPLPVRLPPKPPEPRMKSVDWFSNISWPVDLSFVSTMTVTAAAFPLSSTSRMLRDNDMSWAERKLILRRQTYRASLMRSPLVGMGALIAKYCSP